MRGTATAVVCISRVTRRARSKHRRSHSRRCRRPLRKLLMLLQHKYTPSNMALSQLKGVDRITVERVRRAALRFARGELDVYLVLVKRDISVDTKDEPDSTTDTVGRHVSRYSDIRTRLMTSSLQCITEPAVHMSRLRSDKAVRVDNPEILGITRIIDADHARTIRAPSTLATSRARTSLSTSLPPSWLSQSDRAAHA